MPQRVSSAPGHERTEAAASAATYTVVIVALLWRCLFLGEAFVPARQLEYASPWSASVQTDARLAWNPLHYDSVGQYWAYREYATRAIRSGRLPLWNPHQFCGTPLAANNLSAVYYPGNLLHVILGAARGAGWSAAIHLLLAALLMRAFVRALGLSAQASLLAGAVYAFSAWQVSWLHLPPFLATACWLPALLTLLLQIRRRPSPLRFGGLAGIAALVLLAGHLQIAFYVLSTAALWALWIARSRDDPTTSSVLFVVRVAAALAVGAVIAAPQWLPSAELGRYSHRAGGPTAAGYRAYVAYAAHPSAMVTWFLPDYFGNPSSAERPYLGFSKGGMYYNYAEGAMYVGLLPFVLAVAGATGLRAQARHARFAGVLAALALLIAIGSPVAAALYFGVPGFSGSGSPARILVLFTFALAWLAAAGHDLVTAGSTSTKARLGSVGGAAAAAGVFLAAASAATATILGGSPDPGPEALRQTALLLPGVACVLWLLPTPRLRRLGTAATLALVCGDLLYHGLPYNSAANGIERLGDYDLIRMARAAAGHDRIAPINTSWSFAGPSAALPPNLATALGLYDVQGYDSLFPGQYKRWLESVNGRDPSPPEVGNMVLLKEPDPRILDAAGARVVLSNAPVALPGARQARQANGAWLYVLANAPGRARAYDDRGRKASVDWLRDDAGLIRLKVLLPRGGFVDLRDQYWPGWHAYVGGRPTPIERVDHVFRRVRVPPATTVVEFRYRPATTLVGLYLMCAGVGILAAGGAYGVRRPSLIGA